MEQHKKISPRSKYGKNSQEQNVSNAAETVSATNQRIGNNNASSSSPIATDNRRIAEPLFEEQSPEDETEFEISPRSTRRKVTRRNIRNRVNRDQELNGEEELNEDEELSEDEKENEDEELSENEKENEDEEKERAGTDERRGLEDKREQPIVRPSVGTLLLLSVITVAVLAGLLMYSQEGKQSNVSASQKHKPYVEMEKDIKTSLRNIIAKSSQEKEFWIDVFSGITNLLEENPRQPTVLLIAVPEGGSTTAYCLSDNIARIISHSFEDIHAPIRHDTEQYLHLSHDDHKMMLDEQLHLLNSSHVALILNLERMPAETATLLHGYCDNDNAPFKRSVFMLLLEISLTYEEAAAQHLETLVEHSFNALYAPQLDPDHIPGLVSRLTAQTLLVKPENNTVLQTLCLTGQS